MEAATISTRETVMECVWNKFFEHFSNNDWEKAEGCFGLYTRLEEMTDTQYEEACHCGKPNCYCDD